MTERHEYVHSSALLPGIISTMAVHPLAARALFGATTAELGFPVDDGEDVLGPEAERLRVRLAELPDWPKQSGCSAFSTPFAGSPHRSIPGQRSTWAGSPPTADISTNRT